MILRADRQSLVRRIRAWPARHGPAFENAVYFQTQIPMQSCGIMFLYDEEIALGFGPFPTRLSGFGKVSLGGLAAEGVGRFRHGSGLFPPVCMLFGRRPLGPRFTAQLLRSPSISRRKSQCSRVASCFCTMKRSPLALARSPRGSAVLAKSRLAL